MHSNKHSHTFAFYLGMADASGWHRRASFKLTLVNQRDPARNITKGESLYAMYTAEQTLLTSVAVILVHCGASNAEFSIRQVGGRAFCCTCRWLTRAPASQGCRMPLHPCHRCLPLHTPSFLRDLKRCHAPAEAAHTFTAQRPHHGFDRFAQQDNILDVRNGYLVNDALVLKVRQLWACTAAGLD